MSQSVLCADEAPFVNRQRARAIDAAHPEQRHVFLEPAWWFDLCARWPTVPVDPAAHTPVHSGIPTLIVTGQYDPGTPPAYGRLAAATLTRSYFTEFPGQGHIPENPCVLSVEANFLHQPLQRPDTSCIQRTSPISWETG
jgi:pimeloyl-ACP methyl ester carboxylesterase